MPAVSDKRMLYHTSAHNAPPQGHPSWAQARSANDIAWAREYVEGFEI